jgi:hypothetical protein
MAVVQTPAEPASGGYPVQLSVTPERELNRLWGIPVIGVFVRAILAIPHFAVLWLLGIGLYVWLILGWIPILVNGRVPGIAVRMLVEQLRRGNRVQGYVLFLMAGGYPPLEPGAPSPVDLQVNLETLEINRLWGIPFLGLMVRFLILIPHLIVLSLAGILVGLSLLVLWIPILISGRYPEWAVSLYGGFLRYSARVGAYALLLPVPYPPFSFS